MPFIISGSVYPTGAPPYGSPVQGDRVFGEEDKGPQSVQMTPPDVKYQDDRPFAKTAYWDCAIRRMLYIGV
ncbi:hypothetical protein [Methylobacterium gnaphalii]|uniref:Uncharacterized protein n=1 Tax=Methylobacterium gnaphalii TaxID=1010610 RepID=A0A512JJN5_9HYPH|nr:hypothetical protein [Methylobacterium gnaphalii]GEP10171.1 hypothetical protein MGN01_20160 [Methylobacterium gnaphalii]GJD69521.1 hypothetical protein MMMDOFMJ_2452 [Methylobacterium gnaphalii]GLS48687.1 hypothetical protein GCM10007885_15310 [Methylobacterium gnaphalii]